MTIELGHATPDRTHHVGVAAASSKIASFFDKRVRALLLAGPVAPVKPLDDPYVVESSNLAYILAEPDPEPARMRRHSNGAALSAVRTSSAASICTFPKSMRPSAPS